MTTVATIPESPASQPATKPAEQSVPSAAIHSPGTRSQPSSRPAITLRDRCMVTIQIDSDILLAAEDQAGSQGLSFQEWAQQTFNDSLRAYLGV